MKKLYYIPGAISIILQPLLGYFYFQSHGYFTKLTAHNFTNINFAELERLKKEYEFVSFSNEYDKRAYKEVSLNGNKDISRKTFQYIDHFVNEVIQTRDTINGLKIHFEEYSTYDEFIHVLNIFYKRDAEMYLLDHNTMYFVGRDWSPAEENQPEIPVFKCGTVWDNDIDKPKFSVKQEFNHLKIQFLQNKTIYIAYSLFFIVVLFYIYRVNKKTS